MEDDYRVELKNEYFRTRNKSGTYWFFLVQFDNGDKIKINCNQFDLKDSTVGEHIDKYRLKKRIEKIKKIKCRIN